VVFEEKKKNNRDDHLPHRQTHHIEERRIERE
jgi:hypothetical protein